MLSKDIVLEALGKVMDPELHQSLTDLGMIRDVWVKDDKVDVTIALTMDNCPKKDEIAEMVRVAVSSLPDTSEVSVHLTSMTEEEKKTLFGETKEGAAASCNYITRVVAVMSGKGGVGKSLVTALLAKDLAFNGYRVGILDADITGPSIPMLFGLHGPVEAGPVGIRPLESNLGVKIISMNLLLEREDAPVIWRGPLVGKAITQLWGDVFWGDLDYLLVDLPPGTSDASLTTMQALPVDGIIMVTTPQELASLVVRKAVHMAQLVKTPIIGVVENMAYFTCPESGEKHYIFGTSHSDEVAKAAEAPLMVQLPIDPQVALLCDEGRVEDIDLIEVQTLLAAFQSIPTVRLESPILGHMTFSQKTLQLIDKKENWGNLDNPDARGSVHGWCGDTMQIDLNVKGQRIMDARFITDGCGATVACGSMLTSMVRGKTLAEAGKFTPDELIDALDGLPWDHEHCASLAISTLREAISNAGTEDNPEK